MLFSFKFDVAFFIICMLLALVFDAADVQASALLQGNCSSDATDVPVEPFPPTTQQCIITARDNFLDIAVDGGNVWLSELYIRLDGGESLPRTVLRAGRGDLWMTNVSLKGRGQLCRGVEVHENRRLYARGNSHAYMSTSSTV